MNRYPQPLDRTITDSIEEGKGMYGRTAISCNNFIFNILQQPLALKKEKDKWSGEPFGCRVKGRSW